MEPLSADKLTAQVERWCRATLLQTDIVWEDKQENLRLLRRKLKALRGVAEIVVLPLSLIHI